MAAAPVSAVRAPHVPPTAVVHRAKVEATRSLVRAEARTTGSHRADQHVTVMQERGHRGMVIALTAVRPMIATSGPDQPAATSDHAVNKVTGRSVPLVEGRPSDPLSEVTEGVPMTVHRVAARHAAMVIVRIIVIEGLAVSAPVMIANHAARKKAVVMAPVRHSAQDRVAEVVVTNGLSVPVHPRIASTHATAPVRVGARLPASRSRSPDKSG